MCRKIIFVIVVLLLSFVPASLVRAAGADLLAWWTCDEGEGAVVSDASGNGHDGAFVFGDPAWVEGVRGSAVQLVGPTLVEVAPLNVELTEATMAGWILPNGSQPNWASIMMTRTPGLATGFNILGYQLAYHWNDTSSSWNYRGGDMIAENEWTFAAVTVEPDKATFYINGVPGSVNAVTHGPCLWNSNIYLGGDGNSNWVARRMNGALDDVALFSRALKPAEIKAIMNGVDAYPAPVDPGVEGLLAGYSFEGEVIDISGNGLNGLIMGDPMFSAGQLGLALDLDGVGDYVDCGTNDVLNNLSDAMTVSAWVNIRSVTTAWMAIVAKGETAWRLGVNNTSTGVHYAFSGGTRGWLAANSVTQLPLGEWHHIAGTYDRSVGGTVHVDGVGETVNSDPGGIDTNTQPLLLGDNPEATGRFFDGLIDEVKIYDRALTEGELGYLAGHRALTYDGGALDDTWSHDNGSDAWDGTGPGEGSPGGAASLSEDGVTFLRIQDTGDPRDYGMPDPSNRKVYFTQANDVGLDVVRLEVRARIATTAPLDDQHPDGGAGVAPWPAEGRGYHIRDDGKGMFGIAQGGLGIISFSLAQPGEAGFENVATDVLVMNNLVGAEPSGNVDTADAASAAAVNMLAIDDASQWNTFVIDIVAGGAGTHIVTISANGGEAQSFEVTAGTGVEGDGSYIAIGSSGTGGMTAFDVDYLSVRTPIPPAPPEEPEVVNLLPNGGFENGQIGPYGIYGNATSEVVTDCVDAVVPEGPIEGSYCLHIVVPTAGTNNWDVGMTDGSYTFKAGKTYTFSAFLKCKSGTLDFRMKPERGASPWEGYGDQVFTMTDTWQEFTVTTPVIGADVTPASPTFHFAFAVGDFWVDNVRLFESQ